MPLILLFGQPQTGKKQQTDQLIQLCKQNGKQCQEISLQSLNFEQNDSILKQSSINKIIYQSVQQYLTTDVYVIVNYTNHLKSFRYELFCLAREKRTLFCILTTYNPDATNDTQLMDQELYENIISRFELLNQYSEWDGPVFTEASNVFQYLSNTKQKVQTKRSTQVNKCKQVPMFELLNQATQRIWQQQSVVSDICNVQLYDQVYFTCKRKYQIQELRQLVERFKSEYNGIDNNHDQILQFKIQLEQL